MWWNNVWVTAAGVGGAKWGIKAFLVLSPPPSRFCLESLRSWLGDIQATEVFVDDYASLSPLDADLTVIIHRMANASYAVPDPRVTRSMFV